ncbi:VanZ family protein [Cohnella luojiensis]|uniref:VanZ family protein n=1 Tax=Cohnella luojiensis TaxID=652876 RepID=UPI001F0E98CB|nr:VanZ family protein [Cohnella luojiensis]
MSQRWRYVPALLCMAAIFISSSRSGDQLDSVLPWVQKWLPGLTDFNPMHYVAYFILGLTVAYALGKRAAAWSGVLINVLVCLLYGLTDEWHQAYVPMRSPDPRDLLHDGMGAVAAGLLVMLLYTLFNRRSSRYYTGK